MLKRIFVFTFLVFSCFYLFSNENENSNEKLIQSLKTENNQLKEMLYNKAFVNVNGQSVEINGLIRGFTLAYSKYLQTLNKLEEGGNLTVISGEDLLDYKPYQRDEFYVMVSLKDKSYFFPDPEAAYKDYQKQIEKKIKKEQSGVTEPGFGIVFLIIFNIITLIILIIFGILLNDKSNDVTSNLQETKTDLNRYLSLMDRISSDEQLILNNLDKSIKKHDSDTRLLNANCKSYFSYILDAIFSSRKEKTNDSEKNNSSKNENSLSDFIDLPEKVQNCFKKAKIYTITELLNHSEKDILLLPGMTPNLFTNFKDWMKLKNITLSNNSFFDGLSVRAKHVLKNQGVFSLSSLLDTTWDELLANRNFGKKSQEDLRNWLKEKGLKLKNDN